MQVGARILALADTPDAIGSNHVYRLAQPFSAAAPRFSAHRRAVVKFSRNTGNIWDDLLLDIDARGYPVPDSRAASKV